MASKAPITRKSRPAAGAVAVAACLFDAAGLQDAGAAPAGRVLMQITPAGDFGPSDGRALDVPAWRVDAAIAARVIAAHNPAQPLVIDYEHQTLHAESNGQPAPAAGWIHALRWIDGRGLFAEAELTPRARQQVQDGEYRYFSPVIQYDPASGALQRVLMGALTNNPAIHGMQAIDLMAAATARFNPTHPQETDVTLLQKLLAALGLPADTTEEAALAACAARRAQADAALTGLKLQADADADAIVAACNATAAVIATPATPDPAKFVPIEALQEMQAGMAALSAKVQAREVDDLVAPALADGRLLPAQEVWARDLGKANIAALKQYLDSAQPIAALAGSQTGGQPPAGQDEHGLSADERAVAAACGMTPEQFATGRAAA